jgi:hypothetical protein
MKQIFFCLCFLFSIAPALLQAEERSPIFLDLHGGLGSVFSPSSHSDSHKEPRMIGGRLGRQLSDRWEVGAQFSSYTIGATTSSASDLSLSPITAWVQRDFPWTRLYTPYLLANLGVSRNKQNGTSHEISNTGWTAGISLGLQLKISELHDLSFELGVRQFSRATEDNKDLRTFDGILSLRFFLPQSWVPLKPPIEISDADLEIPLLVNDQEVEIDPTLLAEEELLRMQKGIDSGKIAPITFDPGSAIIQTSSIEALDTLGAILRRYPETRVRIYGFVEESYTGQEREALASARAQVVGTYVVRNFYLNEARLLLLGEKPPAGSSRRITFEALPAR